jgi:hypothetical protein
LAGAFLAVDLDAADFDPAAWVFAFFAGVSAARADFLGAPDGGVVSGGVTRAS